MDYEENDSPDITDDAPAEAAQPDIRDIATDVYDELEAASEDDDAEDVEEQSEEDQADEPEGDEDEKQSEPSDQAAPAHWSARDKERFTALPKEAQDMVLDFAKAQEADYTRKSQELADERRAFEDTFKDEQQYVESMGSKLDDAFKISVAWDKALRNGSYDERMYHAQQFLGQYGLAVPGGQQTNPDQMSQHLSARLQGIEQKFENFISENQKAEEQRKEEAAKSTVETFGSTKDGDGNLVYPHFEDVKQEMALLLNSGYPDADGNPRVTDLDSAYKHAIRLNEDVWGKIQTYQRQKEAAEHMNEVKKAKKASSVNKRLPSKPAGEPDFSNLTDRELTAQVYDMLANE